jgi:hypothetical protein
MIEKIDGKIGLERGNGKELKGRTGIGNEENGNTVNGRIAEHMAYIWQNSRIHDIHLAE